MTRLRKTALCTSMEDFEVKDFIESTQFLRRTVSIALFMYVGKWNPSSTTTLCTTTLLLLRILSSHFLIFALSVTWRLHSKLL